MSHTPSPWVLYDRKNGPDILAGEDLILECGNAGQNWEVNAAFIVRAVNCHDALVLALKNALDEHQRVEPHHHDLCEHCLDMDTAIAKAEGK